MKHNLRKFFRETFRRLATEQKEKKSWRKPSIFPKDSKGNWEHKEPEWYNYVVYENKILITSLHNLYHELQGNDKLHHTIPDGAWSRNKYKRCHDNWLSVVETIQAQ